MAKTRETLRFGDFELDVAAYELRRHGRAVRLERHPMDLLLLLVERRNDLVSRAQIVELLWGKDVFVDVETGVHTAVRKIRQALRDSAETPTFVETVPGRGYRFIAPVEVGGNRRKQFRRRRRRPRPRQLFPNRQFRRASRSGGEFPCSPRSLPSP